MAKRKKRLEEPEEHVNHERWLVTYADMITLLMVLFIVMFAISQVDQKKFDALKSGLSAGFGQEDAVLVGSQGIMDTSGNAPVTSEEVDMVNAAVEEAMQKEAQLRNGRVFGEAEKEADRLEAIRRRIEQSAERRGVGGDIRTRIDDRGLVVSMVSRHVVFQNDLAVLTPRGIQIVSALGPVLADLEDELEIAGHTNQVPVKPAYYASDWDLASARAITVLRRLTEIEDVATDRVQATSYGNTQPLIDPDLAGSQALNKRVDIIILTRLDGESRELLEDAADQDPVSTVDTTSTDAGTEASTDDHSDSAADDPAAGITE
jgi:chemotaxis protein MotB